MSYYYEKTNSYLSKSEVRNKFGSQIFDMSEERQQEYGLFKGYYVDYTYNTYSHKLDSVATTTWTKYTNDSDLLAANSDAYLDEDGYFYPAYFGSRSIVEITGAQRDNNVKDAKKVVFDEVSDRMAKVAGASLALRVNSLSLSDSSSSLSAHLAASDSEILDLAYILTEDTASYDSNWGNFNTSYIGTTSIVSDITAGENLDFVNLPTSDPAVAGKLWRDSDIVKVSLG